MCLGTYSPGSSLDVLGGRPWGPALHPLSLRCFIQPIKSRKQAEDDSFAFQCGSSMVCFESQEVRKPLGEGFALPWLLRPGRCCPAIAHPLEVGQFILSVSQATSSTCLSSLCPKVQLPMPLPSLGTPNSYRRSAQESHIPGLPCRCPLGTDRARPLVPLDGR